MIPYKRFCVIAGFIGFTSIGVAATEPGEPEENYKNLRILSKKTTEDDMERIMYTFNRALGVGCAYCHYTTRDETTFTSVDFASDNKREKIIARKMMKMAISLNKKYFDTKIDSRIRTNPVIWCRTCHRGHAIPKQFQ